MKGNKQPGGMQSFMFFLSFVVLFCLVFALGVIVGKGLENDNLFEIVKKENIEQIIFSSSKNNSDKIEKKQTEKSELKKALKKEEKIPEKSTSKAQVKEVKKVKTQQVKTTEKKPVTIKKKEVKVETTTKEIPKIPAGKTVELDSLNEKEYVAKMDYNKQDFPNTDQEGLYTVQLGSFQNIDAAYALEKKLLAKGYPCFVIKSAIPNKGTWYRVRVGTFKTKDKAADYAKKLKNIEKLEYTQVTFNK